jgi:hypothetical protein
MMNVAAGVGDSMTARGIMTVAIVVIMTVVRASLTEGMVASHAITIAAMMIDGTESWFTKGSSLRKWWLKYMTRFCYVNFYYHAMFF